MIIFTSQKQQGFVSKQSQLQPHYQSKAWPHVIQLWTEVWTLTSEDLDWLSIEGIKIVLSHWLSVVVFFIITGSQAAQASCNVHYSQWIIRRSVPTTGGNGKIVSQVLHGYYRTSILPHTLFLAFWSVVWHQYGLKRLLGTRENYQNLPVVDPVRGSIEPPFSHSLIARDP